MSGKHKKKDKAVPPMIGDEPTEVLGEQMEDEADAIPSGQGSPKQCDLSVTASVFR